MNDEQEDDTQTSDVPAAEVRRSAAHFPSVRFGPKRAGEWEGSDDRDLDFSAPSSPVRQLTVEILLDKQGLFVQQCLLRDASTGEIVGSLSATEANWKMAAGQLVSCELKVLGKWAKVAYSDTKGLGYRETPAPPTPGAYGPRRARDSR